MVYGVHEDDLALQKLFDDRRALNVETRIARFDLVHAVLKGA